LGANDAKVEAKPPPASPGANKKAAGKANTTAAKKVSKAAAKANKTAAKKGSGSP
jgi:hypothetical protein